MGLRDNREVSQNRKHNENIYYGVGRETDGGLSLNLNTECVSLL